jgi:hypothetical protein
LKNVHNIENKFGRVVIVEQRKISWYLPLEKKKKHKPSTG